MIVSNETTIVRERQLAVRRELDRRGVSLKAVAYDSGIPYATLLSYFPGERHKEPHTISGAAIYALCAGGAMPADLLSMFLPDGWQIVRAPEQVDHDKLCEMAADYVAAMIAATHPESECGRDIGPTENGVLTGKAVTLKVAA